MVILGCFTHFHETALYYTDVHVYRATSPYSNNNNNNNDDDDDDDDIYIIPQVSIHLKSTGPS